MFLRNLAKQSRWLNKSCNNNVFQCFASGKNSIENIEKDLTVFQEYKEAKTYQSQNKYGQANELLQRVLDIFERSQLQSSDPYVYLLQRLAQNEIALKNTQKADAYLQKVIANTDFSNTESFKNLFLLYLKTDVQKALDIAQRTSTALREKGASSQEQSKILFYIGTAHLLSGNYEEATQNLKKCIENISQNSLKGSALNNLALTLWWKAPPQAQNPVSEISSLFKESILNTEDPAQLDETRRKDFDELFRSKTLLPADFARIVSDDQVLVKNKESNKPLFNLANYLYSLGAQNKNDAAFWIRYTMKVIEKNDPENINKVLILLAKFYSSSKQYIRAEGLFRSALELSENKPEDKLNCLRAYGETLQSITNRKSEGDNMLEDAKNLEKQVPTSALKLDYLSLPQINL